jgi:hypothetical protein
MDELRRFAHACRSLNQLEVERLAADARRVAGVGPCEIVRAPVLIAALLGARAVAVAPTLRTSACLTVVDGRYLILLRKISDESNFDMMHEGAHAILRGVVGYRGPHEERTANALAAAMLASPDAVRRWRGAAEGERLGPLARAFGLSQTGMFLRLGEVRGDERAVVTRSGNVLIRSQGAFPWATAPIADLAQAKARWPSVRKARLRGGIDEGRVTLRAVLTG